MRHVFILIPHLYIHENPLNIHEKKFRTHNSTMARGPLYPRWHETHGILHTPKNSSRSYATSWCWAFGKKVKKKKEEKDKCVCFNEIIWLIVMNMSDIRLWWVNTNTRYLRSFFKQRNPFFVSLSLFVSRIIHENGIFLTTKFGRRVCLF